MERLESSGIIKIFFKPFSSPYKFNALNIDGGL
jgi:hypothetical protein